MARRTAQAQTLQPPDLDEAECFSLPVGGMLRTDGHYEEVVLNGGEYAASQLFGLTIGPAVLTKVIARAARWRELQLTDVRLTGCDLANIDCVGAKMRRVELLDGRLTGANLSDSRLSDLRVANCKADAAWFTRTVFEHARFERCDLRSANFEKADLRGVVFNDCDLRLARLTSARLAGADLRGSNLQGIEAGPGDFRGAIIEPMQAADLIALLGVTLGNRGDRP